MCALLVGLPAVVVVGVGEWPAWLLVAVASAGERPVCECGAAPHRHGVVEIDHVDLPVFGRPTRLRWRKQRWRCPGCRRCWRDRDSEIASERCRLTTRAARWATFEVGHGRPVADVARVLACDWHTVMDAVMLYGSGLIDDTARFGAVSALGLDETLFARHGQFRSQLWSTQIVDVACGQLLDIVEGRDSAEPCRWLAARPQAWRDAIKLGDARPVEQLSVVFDTMLPHAVQVADPFHVVRLANDAVDECRRRVQNDTLGHRGHKNDPLHRARRRLVIGRRTPHRRRT
ncbi:MAG: transposase [Haloechinothrix sp.]